MKADTKADTKELTQESRFAYSLLKLGFVLAPVIAGLDKFFMLLTDWTRYLAPVFPDLVGLEPAAFMMIVGVVEIVAGVGVAIKPRIFAPVVGLWLISIIINLLILGSYYDIALRDFGLAIGAFALSKLALAFEEPASGRVTRKHSRRVENPA